jgi:hypothetical protein
MESFNDAIACLYFETLDIGQEPTCMPGAHLLFSHLTEQRVMQLHQSIVTNTQEVCKDNEETLQYVKPSGGGGGGEETGGERSEYMSPSEQSVSKLLIEQMYRVKVLMELRKLD